jgi:hypothetical protein
LPPLPPTACPGFFPATCPGFPPLPLLPTLEGDGCWEGGTWILLTAMGSSGRAGAGGGVGGGRLDGMAYMGEGPCGLRLATGGCLGAEVVGPDVGPDRAVGAGTVPLCEMPAPEPETIGRALPGGMGKELGGRGAPLAT